jgi:hypothetical protein
MYVPYTHDTYGQYVFSETFRAKDDAPTSTTTVAISVSQPGRTTVSKLVRIAVIRKGLLPSQGSGIRPPATVKNGSGGEYCVWRYKLVGDPPPCFHFVAAACDEPRYTNPRNGYELVGSNMKWSEADDRIEDLSSYFDDKYGCRAAGGGITDTDGDGKADNEDGCPTNPDKQAPGQCGCQRPDTDTDGDGTADCNDGCPDDAEKTEAGTCGCGVSDADSDRDDTPDCRDNCPDDSSKTEPGICGCGYSDDDTDKDGAIDCQDECPEDPNKVKEGYCGCGKDETDSDGDAWPDCMDTCPNDRDKQDTEGACGCGNPETDSDGDGTPDCIDMCANDPDRTERPCTRPASPVAGDDEDDEGGDDRTRGRDTDPGDDDERDQGPDDDERDRNPYNDDERDRGPYGDEDEADPPPKQPVDPNIADRFRDRERDRDDRQTTQRTTDIFRPPDKGTDIDDDIDDLIDDVEDEESDDGHSHGPGQPTPTPQPAPPPPPPPQAPSGPAAPPAGGLTDVTVGVTPTDVYVWDYGTEDFDRVDLVLNGQLVQGNVTLRKARQKFVLQLKPGPNTLMVRALNIGDPQMQIDLGLPPYNAAAIEIQGVKVGNASQQWELSQGQTGSMTITYTP